MRIPFITLIAGGALALGGCAYGGLGLGMGYGDPYSSYGYGYGSPYGAGYGGYGGYGYGSPYYGGYGYGSPYYGWYDDYYYPGTGIYVYDSYRRPRMWTNAQRSYWMSRQQTSTKSATRTVSASPNWSGFNRRQQQQQQQARSAQRQQPRTQDPQREHQR